MAHQLYKQGSFEINGEPATLNQLEGRFAFINQLTWYNNKIDGIKTHFNNLSSREFNIKSFYFINTFLLIPSH